MTVAKIRENKNPEVEIQQDTQQRLQAHIQESLERLATQVQQHLTLAINQIVKVTFGAKPVKREDTTKRHVVDIAELSHVYVGRTRPENEDAPSVNIVRLIFGDMLFAAVGECAEKLIAWAEKAVTMSKSAIIAAFPEVSFQYAGRVKFLNGEMMAV